MKLVRLISPADINTSIAGQKADFFANFQEPFEIKPNSKVSLQNFSISLEDQLSVSNSNPKNNTFSIVAQDTASTTDPTKESIALVSINAGSYELNDFLSELNRALNFGLINPLSLKADGTFEIDVDSPDAQFLEMTTSFTTQKHLTISYQLLEVVEDNHTTDVNIDGDGGQPETYSKQPTADAGAWAYSFAQQGAILSKGQGYGEITLDTDSTVVDGWAFGLALYRDLAGADQGLTSDSFEPVDYKYCVFAEAGTYHTAENGVIVDTGVAVVLGDKVRFGVGRYRINPVIELATSPSRFVFVVERDAGGVNLLLLGATNTNDINNYNVAFSIQDDGIILKQLRFVESFKSGEAIVPKASNKYYSLAFTPASQNLLGFTTPTTTPINDVSANIQGDLIIYSSLIPSSIAIEIPTLNISSYDSDESFQRRRSLVGVIPSTALNVENNTISYSQPYPVMLDIKNNATQLINSLRVRIVDSNNNPLVMSKTIPKATEVCVIFDN